LKIKKFHHGKNSAAPAIVGGRRFPILFIPFWGEYMSSFIKGLHHVTLFIKVLDRNKLRWKSISFHDISITWKETVLEHFTIHNLI
jgi:hypothetical protein